ncbi:fasciclin-3 isoform X1 [Drosophila nasuta]|uniref:Fasciclin-3 isoform X7 n=1 Tax=Drosophila albomicans TaxID=7291 RepID=A0A6P8XVQ8_DROAB|nr:fasciclin-3 isoform X7 [Drosophila albomicans]XP_060644530.1 fasciclin-3 isoform X1 [Drosophila nasuta]
MSRIVLVFLAAILSDALSYGQVNVEPNTALLNEGDRTELLCRYGRAINYCRIEIPGEQKVLNLSPVWSKTPGFTYYGAGLNAGQCGVSIEHVKASNNGQVKCSLGVEGEELSGTIDLVVALRPKQPMIELITKPNRDGYFSENTEFHARCIVRDGRPPANISWYIDNMPANKNTNQLQILSTPTHDNVELSTSVQEIKWHLAPEDSNRKLVCRSHHQTDRESVPAQEAAYIIMVRCATLNTDLGPDSEAQIHPETHEELDGQDNADEHIDTTPQSEEVTPPVTDKLEAQKKADLKKSAAATAAAVIAAGNGQQHGADAPKPPNTSV